MLLIWSSPEEDLPCYLVLHTTTNKSYLLCRLQCTGTTTRCRLVQRPVNQSGESSEATCRECRRQPLQLPATFTATQLCSCQLSPPHISYQVLVTSLIPHQAKFYSHVSVKVSSQTFPPLVGRAPSVMDSSVHDNVTKPMDNTAFEDSTCQSSESSKTLVNPEASQTPHTPAQKQASDGDGFEFPKGRRRKAKLPARKPVAAAVPKPQTPMDASKKSQSSQPLFKQPTVVDPNIVYLWNAGGRHKNKKAPRANASDCCNR